MRASFSEAAFSWPDFSVLHFETDKKFPEIVQNWKKSATFAPIESCARQVWAATREAFAKFPFKAADQDVSILHGEQAYAYVLRLLTGMMSERVGEDHIVRQYREKWDHFQSIHPEFAAYMNPVRKALEDDNAMIRKNLVSLLIPPLDEYAVRIVSGLEKGDRILVLSHLTRDGEPSVDSKKIMKSYGNNRNGKPLVSEIAVTGHSLSESQKIAEWLATLKDQRKLHKDIAITVMPINSFGRAVESYNRIYITTPMNKHSDMDQNIIQSWKSRIRRDNILTHMRGDPDLQAHSHPVWIEASLDSYVSPEDIRHARLSIQKHNQHIIPLIHEAIDDCASCRERGERPRKLAQVERVDYSIQPRPVISP